MSPSEPNALLAYFRSRVGHQLATDVPSVTTWLGGVLREIDENAISVSFLVRPEMTNPTGVLHGGMAVAMMDDLSGLLVLASHAGRYFTSVNLAVDFLAPVRSGETIIARAQIVRRGRRLVNVQCTIETEEGSLVAHASTNLIAVAQESKPPLNE